LGNYRSKLDITADILNVVSHNAKKTKIMYEANLSYKLLTRYLAEALESSLIHFDPKDKCYVLTPKGREFLEKYQDYLRHNHRAEKVLNDVNAKRKSLEELCSDV